MNRFLLKFFQFYIKVSQNSGGFLQLWNLYPVLNILYSLVGKSQINIQLRAANNNGSTLFIHKFKLMWNFPSEIEIPENVDDQLNEFGRHPLYSRLGYFSLIGLCRLHVLLGDYFQATKTIENIHFNAQVEKYTVY